MECLPTVEIAWLLILYSEVEDGEIVYLLRGNGHETGIEDRVADRVEASFAGFIKRGARDCMILLLEDEADNVAGFSDHIIWYE